MTGLRSEPAHRLKACSPALQLGRQLPLALVAIAAFASPALAAGHHAPMPVRRAPSAQPVKTAHSAAGRNTREVASGRSSAKAHTADRHSVASGNAHVARGGRGVAYAAAVHGRQAEASVHDWPGSRRVGRSASGRSGRAEKAQVVAAPEQVLSRRGHRQEQAAATSTQLRKAASPAAQVASVADNVTSARVHAWYNRQNTAAAVLQDGKITPRSAAPAISLASVPANSASTALVPRKAAVPEPVRAALGQRDAALAAAEQKEHQTTAADDNADAESHIPSTAPTERVPAPFVHGDALQPGAILPANRSRDDGAPVLHQQPLTGPRASVSPVSSLVPQRTDPGTKTIRSTTADTAQPVLSRTAPAAASIQANARKPKLDAAVSQGMAEENFDDDDAPATARTAVALAASGASAANRKTVAALQTTDEPLPALAAVNVNLYDSSGHLLVMAPMKGSHEILVHQNQMAVQDGLERVQDDGQLSRMRRQGTLVALPDDQTIFPNDVLPLNRRYARSWTVRFLRDLGRAHYARFGTPLIVTSAVRTVAFQRHLVRVNGNAAPPTGDIASPHLYGQAVDIGKRGMGLTELTWMRAYLTPVESDGKIDVEEEFQQACFHISVYRKYAGGQEKLPQRLQVPTLLQAKAAPAQEARPEPKQERGRRHLPTALLATGLR